MIRSQSEFNEKGIAGSMVRLSPTLCLGPTPNPAVIWMGTLIESANGFSVSFANSCNDLLLAGVGDAGNCCPYAEIASMLIARLIAVSRISIEACIR